MELHTKPDFYRVGAVGTGSILYMKSLNSFLFKSYNQVSVTQALACEFTFCNNTTKSRN